MFVPKLKAWQAAVRLRTVRPVACPNLKAFARPAPAQKNGYAVEVLPAAAPVVVVDRNGPSKSRSSVICIPP